MNRIPIWLTVIASLLGVVCTFTFDRVAFGTQVVTLQTRLESVEQSTAEMKRQHDEIEKQLASISAIEVKVSGMAQEVGRVRDRLDRFLDKQETRDRLQEEGKR